MGRTYAEIARATTQGSRAQFDTRSVDGGERRCPFSGILTILHRLSRSTARPSSLSCAATCALTFDRLNVNPRREVFKLDLVDGFAGGGTFRDGDEIVSGTPLIMLEEAEAAIDRINRGRAKPQRFDCKHYFVDKEAAHTAHLRRALTDRGYQVDGGAIVVRNSRFEDEADGIISEIRRRQPRSGRAIFLLDQTGFSQVELELVARIFRDLRDAEIILTFAADALVNHLSMTPALIKSAAPLELTEAPNP